MNAKRTPPKRPSSAKGLTQAFSKEVAQNIALSFHHQHYWEPVEGTLDVSLKLLKPQLHLLENNFSLPTLR
ncbi:MAG: hypothetical protein ABR985_15780 [Methanotrichaceae archaeon]